jgi:hypothetical protein
LIGAEEIFFGGRERSGVTGALKRRRVLNFLFELVDAGLENLDLLLQRCRGWRCSRG